MVVLSILAGRENRRVDGDDGAFGAGVCISLMSPLRCGECEAALLASRFVAIRVYHEASAMLNVLTATSC